MDPIVDAAMLAEGRASKDSLTPDSTLGVVNSHNEWSKLREVIVGTASGAAGALRWRRPEVPAQDLVDRAIEISTQAFPDWLLEEVEEDLSDLAAVLTKFGAVVHRPDPVPSQQIFSAPGWCASRNNNYNVRDLHLIVGNAVIEAPSHRSERYFEPFSLYALWHRYFRNGLRWISAPKPRLDQQCTYPYYRDEKARVLTAEDRRSMELSGGRYEKLHRLTEYDIMFEAASVTRMGTDLLYLVSSTGNWKGARWLQSILGDAYKVHTTTEIYRSGHIDSTVIPLRPGLVLLNSTRVNADNCPEVFSSWDKLMFDDVAAVPEVELKFQRDVRELCATRLEELGFETDLRNFCSPWIGLNLFSLDEQTVVVDQNQHALIKVLEQRGITAIPVRMRHMFVMDGGLHCATLDTVREGTLETYS